MRPSETPRVIAGSVLLAAILLIAGLVFFLNDVRAALERQYDLVVVFSTAQRLRIGSPVWIGGKKVGRVAAIGFRSVRADSAPTVAVRIKVPRRYRTLLRRDTQARLATARLIGEPAVDLAPGSAGTPVLAPGDTIYAHRIRRTAHLYASLRELRSAFDSLRTEAYPLKAVLEQRYHDPAGVVGRIDRLQNEFARTRRVISQGSAAALLSDPMLGASLARMSATAGQFGPALEAVSRQYNDPALRYAIDRLSHRSGKVAKQLQSLSDQLARGSLPRFATDSAIQKAVHRAQAELDSLVAETKRNPLRYWLGNPGK